MGVAALPASYRAGTMSFKIALLVLFVVLLLGAWLLLGRRRDAAAAGPAPARDDPAARRQAFQDRLAAEREKLGRLVAGAVELVDIGAILGAAGPPAPAALAAALAVAGRIARAGMGPGDIVMACPPDALVMVFDGLDRPAADAKARAIAAEIAEALCAGADTRRFAAEGYARELDDHLGSAVIDTVEDLLRVLRQAQAAHRAEQARQAREAAAAGALALHPVRRMGSLEETALLAGWQAIPAGLEGGDAAARAELDCLLLDQAAKRAAALPLVLRVAAATLMRPLTRDNWLAGLRPLRGRRPLLLLAGVPEGRAGELLAWLTGQGLAAGLDCGSDLPAARALLSGEGGGPAIMVDCAAVADGSPLVGPLLALAREAAGAGRRLILTRLRLRNLTALAVLPVEFATD
ncbi:MAG: hypothetical protein OHK0024_22000 [Thalassobaculales bacterium]